MEHFARGGCCMSRRSALRRLKVKNQRFLLTTLYLLIARFAKVTCAREKMNRVGLYQLRVLPALG